MFMIVHDRFPPQLLSLYSFASHSQYISEADFGMSKENRKFLLGRSKNIKSIRGGIFPFYSLPLRLSIFLNQARARLSFRRKGLGCGGSKGDHEERSPQFGWWIRIMELAAHAA